LRFDLGTIQLRRDACRLDVAAFDQLVAQDDPAALAAAADLYRGELMAGLQLDGCTDFEQWLTIDGSTGISALPTSCRTSSTTTRVRAPIRTACGVSHAC
jgi:hypothetical protein